MAEFLLLHKNIPETQHDKLRQIASKLDCHSLSFTHTIGASYVTAIIDGVTVSIDTSSLSGRTVDDCLHLIRVAHGNAVKQYKIEVDV